MDMAELATRTVLPVRKLRYVFDHHLLPGVGTDLPGQGVPRTFTDFEGFGIAIAARLLDAGLTRKLVAVSLEIACRQIATQSRQIDAPLLRIYSGSNGVMEIGNAQYLRLRGIGR